MTRRDAETEADNLLTRHEVTNLPIPVEQIAAAENIAIIRQRFDGDQSGFAYQDDQHRIIGVNSATSRRRQRFTIAHELGHLLLQSNPLRIDRAMHLYNRDHRASLAIDPDEIEANAFAAALLMPKGHVLRELESSLEKLYVDGRERLITHLAQIFDVSGEAMGYRLINLGVIRS